MTAPTTVAPPAVRARRRPWRPTLGAPRRVLDTTFSGVGLTVAAWFFALSLLPSLLPRAAMVQGIVSGVTVMIGYGIGAGTQALWRYLGIPSVPGRTRRVLVAVFVGLGLWAAVFTGWRQVGWQNEIRTLYGMEPVSPTVWPVIIGLTVLLAVLILVVARSLRLLFRTVFGWLGRRLPRRVAVVVGSAVLLALIWSLLRASSSTASSPSPTTSSRRATPSSPRTCDAPRSRSARATRSPCRAGSCSAARAATSSVVARP